MSRHVFGLAVLLAVLPAGAAEKQPVRAGFLTVNSGALAAGGRQMGEGLTLYPNEHGNKLAGPSTNAVSLDRPSHPAATRARTQDGVGRDNVPVRVGQVA